MKYILILLLGLFGCAHDENASDLAGQGDCDAAMDKMPWEEAEVTFTETSKQVGGTIASYAASGAGYIADAFFLIGEGTFKTVIYCPYATAAIAAAALGTKGHIGGGLYFCNNGLKIEGSHFGSKIYTGTSAMRTADFDKISQANRDVARCYLRRNTPEDRMAAKTKLQNLATDENFIKKLSVEEKERLLSEFHAL